MDHNSARWEHSNYKELGQPDRGILTVYANGKDVLCATREVDVLNLARSGPSPATALVAGYVAMMLARGVWNRGMPRWYCWRRRGG